MVCDLIGIKKDGKGRIHLKLNEVLLLSHIHYQELKRSKLFFFLSLSTVNLCNYRFVCLSFSIRFNYPTVSVSTVGFVETIYLCLSLSLLLLVFACIFHSFCSHCHH